MRVNSWLAAEETVLGCLSILGAAVLTAVAHCCDTGLPLAAVPRQVRLAEPRGGSSGLQPVPCFLRWVFWSCC